MRAQEADSVLAHIVSNQQLIVPLANGEPAALLDAIEGSVDILQGVGVHQMHAIHERPYMTGGHRDRLRHISYFLSHITRPHFASGGIDLVPAHFSEVFAIMRARTTDPLVIAAASPPDRHGYFSLGTNSDYVASMIGRVPFFLEATPNMPRTHGSNMVHHSQVVGWCESDRPLVEVPRAHANDVDRTIGELVADIEGARSLLQLAHPFDSFTSRRVNRPIGDVPRVGGRRRQFEPTRLRLGQQAGDPAGVLVEFQGDGPLGGGSFQPHEARGIVPRRRRPVNVGRVWREIIAVAPAVGQSELRHGNGREDLLQLFL